MPLVVPILRLLLLFSNVYDSFKTLKYPRPSSRNGGHPTVRAMTARKRAIKGCIAVWIVWCYVAVYERMFEGFVSLLVPFYDELKSLVLLFLIFSRARGAEPIYLHLIRPFLKPYTPTVDAILDVLRILGDALFTLASFPYREVEKRWVEQHADNERELASDYDVSSDQRGGRLGVPPPAYRQPSGVLPHLQPRPVSAEATQTQSHDEILRRFSDDASARQSQLYSGNGYGLQGPQRQYEIWHPPPSSYHEASKDDPPPYAPDVNIDREIQQLEEWRQYPPFPSAYPATPIARPKPLIPGQHPPMPSPIPEEPVEQDFQESLLRDREPLNPGSDDCLSDGTIQSRVPTSSDEESHIAVDEDDDEEDDFNVTLGTPVSTHPTLTHPSRMLRDLDIGSRTSSSSGDLNPPKVITTRDDESSLRTPDSENSPLMSEDDFSLLRRKRPHPPEEEGVEDEEVVRPSSFFLPDNVSKRASRKAVPPHSQNIPSASSVSGSTTQSSGDENDGVNNEYMRPEIKKRKIMPPPASRMTRSRSKDVQEKKTLSGSHTTTTGRRVIAAPVSQQTAPEVRRAAGSMSEVSNSSKRGKSVPRTRGRLRGTK